MPSLKLGLKPAHHDPRTLKLSSYLGSQLPPPPDQVAWHDKVRNWPMLLNDRIGDCAIAGPLHQIQCWTANDGTEIVPTDEQAVEAYERIGGYDPMDSASDNGCVMLDVMRAWKSQGIGGRRIGAFAGCYPGDHDVIASAVWLFGSISVGLRLPLAAKDQAVWSTPSRWHRSHGKWARDSWGGHMVPIVGYDARFLVCVTWGELKRLSWEFFSYYCDEAYAAISADWLGPDSKAPNGFSTAQLAKDLAAIH